VKAVAGTTIALAALVVATAGAANEAVPTCVRLAPERGPRGLPAAVSLKTRCADFVLRPDGSVRPAGDGLLAGAQPRGSIGYADGSWWRVVAGRLTAERGGYRLWRSTRRYPAFLVLEGATAGTNAVAFAYRSRLFVAAGGYRAVERLVARKEQPLGWTRDGLLVTHSLGGRSDVRLRTADGRFIAVVQRKPRAVHFDHATQSVFVVTADGRAERFDGRSTTSMARLRERGMPLSAWIQPLAGGLVGMTAQRRVAILRADGSLIASARFPPGRYWNAVGNSGLVADPNGRAVALTMTEGNTGYASHGAEWIMVLREGDRVARVAHRVRLRFAVCERWTTLAWRGDWLLYSTTEGRALAIDTIRRRVVDLTPLVARLPGGNPDGQLKVELEARWTRA
jgi:hypothetical protein